MTKKVIITVNCQNFVRFVSPKDILYCKAENGYTCLYISGEKEYLLCKSLSKFAGELNLPEFLRVNQSYLVNAHYIDFIDKRNKNIKLKNEVRIPITIKVKDILKKLENLTVGGELE